jgi:hypothetical protein
MRKATGSCGAHLDLARVLLGILEEVFNGFPGLIVVTDDNSDVTGKDNDRIEVFVFQLRNIQDPV